MNRFISFIYLLASTRASFAQAFNVTYPAPDPPGAFSQDGFNALRDHINGTLSTPAANTLSARSDCAGVDIEIQLVEFEIESGATEVRSLTKLRFFVIFHNEFLKYF